MRRITQREWESADRAGTADRFVGFLFSFVPIGGLWFGAILTWGAALGISILPFIVAGAAVGGFLGFSSGAVVARQSSRVRAEHMTTAAWLTFIPLALLVTGVGIVVWVVRAVVT